MVEELVLSSARHLFIPMTEEVVQSMSELNLTKSGDSNRTLYYRVSENFPSSLTRLCGGSEVD